jgi:cytochrome c
MPASLRFVGLLLAMAVVAGAASVFVLFRQDSARAQLIAEQVTGGHVAAGKADITRFGCGACHQINGIAGADGRVGPSLEGIAVRATIAGRLPNQPAQMMRWLRAPQHVVPGNGMPDQAMTPRDARDLSAYLYTLR